MEAGGSHFYACTVLQQRLSIMQNALFIVHYTKGEKVIIKDCGRYKYLFDSIKGPVDYVVIHVPDVLITAHNLLSSALKSSAIFNNKP